MAPAAPAAVPAWMAERVFEPGKLIMAMRSGRVGSDDRELFSYFMIRWHREDGINIYMFAIMTDRNGSSHKSKKEITSWVSRNISQTN
jgi:hypothetical protein